MYVALIRERHSLAVLAVIEVPAVHGDILSNWVASMGVAESAINSYQLSLAPVIPYHEITKINVPFCNQCIGEGI